MARRRLGLRGEDQAAAWYQARGYEVVARNWSCREGEIDLVVRQARKLVFCEVKTRTTAAFGVPAEAVTRQKQIRLRHLAARWLSEIPNQTGESRSAEIRFDVAAILGGEIEVIEGAF